MRAVRLFQLLTAAAALFASTYAYAQFGFRGGGEFLNIPARYPPTQLPDRNFVVCRLQYTSVRREPSGGGWRTDYPYGEINLTTRLSELTRTAVSRGPASQYPARRSPTCARGASRRAAPPSRSRSSSSASSATTARGA